MQRFVYFIQRYKFFLYFSLLQIFSLILTVNNHNFHKSKIISSANLITGGIYNNVAKMGDYFNLKSKNDILLEENHKLKNQVQFLLSKLDSVKYNTIIDSLKYKQKYSYVLGKIIKNEYTKSYNYITVNRGENQGVGIEMAVINGKGIIGITDDVTNGYVRVRSILSRNSKINARFKNSYYFGTLTWNAKDYNIVQLTDIPRQANFKLGDTIITGGRSSIFPEGIPIGKVISLPKKKSASNTIDIQLFNDMSNLGYVYIVNSFHKQEIKKLEEGKDE
ncbi:MAG: rod shape-determining protein MreC [Tenacibaculum sp.]|nr:rod shape-determining protein MreC [Tenacibaculum sp.]